MKYMNLDQRGRIQAEYVWIDANGGTRSKTKVWLISIWFPSFVYLLDYTLWACGAWLLHVLI